MPHPVPAKIDGYPRRLIHHGARGRDPFHQRTQRSNVTWVHGSWNDSHYPERSRFVYRAKRLHPPSWKHR